MVELSIPAPLAHLAWTDDQFEPEPGKIIPYLKTNLAYWQVVYGDDCAGMLTIALNAFVYPKSFQVRVRIEDSPPDLSVDIEDMLPAKASRRLLYRGTVAAFSANFQDVIKQLDAETDVIFNQYIPPFSRTKDVETFVGWYNPPFVYTE